MNIKMTEIRDIVKTYAEKNPSDISIYLLRIYDTVVERKAKVILELGTSDGDSTVALFGSSIITGGKLISLDIDDIREMVKNKLLRLFSPVEKEWIFYQINDLDFEWKYARKGEKIDILFIDTVHTYDHTIAELKKFIPLMSLNGVIIMHDTTLDAGKVDKAIETVFDIKKKLDWSIHWIKKIEYFDWEKLRKINIENFPDSFGLAIINLDD